MQDGVLGAYWCRPEAYLDENVRRGMSVWARVGPDVERRAVRSLRTGGVIINGSSTWRTDQLAYGGVKDSGIGREGPRYSIRDMTEERMVLFNY